jgi:hypothetical protein
VDFKGSAVFSPGKLADGSFSDTRISKDWVAARMAERVSQVLLNASAQNRKVPFNAIGLALMEGELKDQLDSGAPPRMDPMVAHFDPGTVWTSVPSMDDVSAQDKANRTMPAIQGGAVLSGAGQSVTFNIYLPDA